MLKSDNKILRISALILIVVIIFQFLWLSESFYKEYQNLGKLATFNKFSSIISDILHRTQQERGAASGYIGSNGKKFKDIYELKIKNTDREIQKYFDFLKKHHYANKSITFNIKTINYYIKELPKIRQRVKSLQISFREELNFYTSMNSNLLTVMDKLVVLTNNDRLVKGLSAYDNFEKAKEKIGIERAILSGTFSLDEWIHNLYIKYVTLLAEQKLFLENAMAMSNEKIRSFYHNIKKDRVFKEVARMENIALNKEKDFGVDPIYWYQIITKKLNLLDEINIQMYHSNEMVIKKIKNQLLFKIFVNLGISIFIAIFVFYTLYLFRKENRVLIEKATYDQLTGLYNREFFISEFNISKARAKRNSTKVAVIFIDLDGFKDINDSLGHKIGDEVLKETAKRLKNSVRESDTVARFGGDEFLIMLDDIKHIEDVLEVAGNLLNEIKKPIIINGIENRISASIGISIYPDDGNDIQTLIKNADMSMYKSKNAGKDRITFYENQMSEESNKRLQLKNDIYSALEKEQFKLYYQAQINKQGKLIGMEVLIRWEHPKLGIVSPFYFIPLAIEIGFIEEIDLWVMKNSLKQAKKWLAKGYDFGVISCNLTVFQLERGNLVDKLKDLFEETEVDPKYFALEITEEGIMKNPYKNIQILKQLKDMKLTLSIDDFGTGYSSFSYLKKLPIDKLKIDRTFIKDLESSEDDKVITSIIISLAKQLHLQTIAEGVETEAQKDFVFSQGCDAIQGYYYSKPIPADEFENKFLISNS